MFGGFKRIRCQCSYCGHVWRIPQRRIVRFERFFKIKKGHPMVWECHDCHEGIVIPASYVNIHGERATIDLNNLESRTEVIRF